MPIGVPKVPYRIPGDEEATWVDLYNVMYRERTLFFLVHCPIHRKKCFSTGINILSGISSDNCCIVSQPRKTLRTSKFYMIFPIISFIRPANKIRSWLALQKNNYMPYKLASSNLEITYRKCLCDETILDR